VLLREAISREASDLHLTVPAPPLVRIRGELTPLDGFEPLRPEDTQRLLREMLKDETRLRQFEEECELDFSVAIPGLARFRVNAFMQRGSVALVCRAIPDQAKTVEDLGLPEVVRNLANEHRGIILVTGATGSGKSTTLTAMVDHINRTYAKHIVTIEDPIEFLHRNHRSVVNQREVGSDTASFNRALRRVVRQDPDVVLIGELRDEETVRTALSAAETGHLVLSTLHTIDATETINRLVDFFSHEQQPQIRSMLAATLKGIVSQRLAPSADGGRVAICEVMVATGRARDAILDREATAGLHAIIAEGAYYGMQTFDQALLEHHLAGRITFEDAMHAASSPHDFKLQARAGAVAQQQGDAVPAGAGAPGPAANGAA
jgi:twitching motility protein PilT